MNCLYCNRSFGSSAGLREHMGLCGVSKDLTIAQQEITQLKSKLIEMETELTTIKGRKTKFAFEPSEIRFSRERAVYIWNNLMKQFTKPYTITSCTIRIGNFRQSDEKVYKFEPKDNVVDIDTLTNYVADKAMLFLEPCYFDITEVKVILASGYASNINYINYK